MSWRAKGVYQVSISGTRVMAVAPPIDWLLAARLLLGTALALLIPLHYFM